MSVAADGRGRVPMLEVNPHVMCVLCGGYFIDATTIIECLHSFCRKCIVTYLESSRFCPICDVQVHKTKPLLSIRPDATLQDIVYKLVPGLYRDEMRRRREFYASRPASELPGERGEARGEERRAVFAPDELLVVRLQYQYLSGPPCPGQVRYLRCPAQVTIGHLQHMIGCKHELSAGRRVELVARGEVLTGDLMLLDVAYLHCWRRVGPLQLYYRIVTVPMKRALTEVDSEPTKVSAAAAGRVCRDLAGLPNGGEAPPPAIIPAIIPAAAAMVARPQPALASHVKEESPPPVEPPAASVAAAAVAAANVAVSASGPPVVTTATEATSPPPRQRRTESGECKEVQLHISETGEMTFGNGPAAGGGGGPVDILQQACSILDSLETDEPEPDPAPGLVSEPVVVPPSQPLPAAPRVSSGVPACAAPPPPLAVPLLSPPIVQAPAVKGPIRDSNKNEIGPESRPARPPDDTGQKRPAKETAAPGRPRQRVDEGRKRSSPVGYKTLKTPPKSWNPRLPRSYVGSGQKSAEPGRTVSPIAPKPSRFFKMRHSSGTAGGPPAEAARAPLLMRLEPSGLPPVAWSDQLLSAGQLSVYPHLYAAQPLSFLRGPAVSMFAPPPAHTGVSQLTYTSAPGSFPTLLTAPRPPAQRHLSAPVKSTSANGVQKPALSAAVSSDPTSAPSASSPAAERPHISCSVPNSRPRPIERPPSAAPAPVGPAAAAAAAAARLSLNSFLHQSTVPGPPTLLGAPYSAGLGGRPIANGQAPMAPRKEDAPPPLPPPTPPGVLRKEPSNNSSSKTKERPPQPPLSSAGDGGKLPAPAAPAQGRSAPPTPLSAKAIVESRPPVSPAPVKLEKTAVTQS